MAESTVAGRAKQVTGGAAAVPAAVAAKRDVLTLAKALRSSVRNIVQCREIILQLHARIFEQDTREGFLKFILNATGGVAALLATIENHVSDTPYLELALLFLCNLMHFGGRRNPRVVHKIAKKGGSRVCLSILGKHSNNIRVVHPTTMAIIALASVDSKMLVTARLSGGLTTLLTLAKSHASLPRDGLASVLSCLCSLARGEQNLQQLGKKGTVLVLLELCARHLRQPSSPVLRWVLKTLVQLCAYEDNAREAAREGAVTLALHALYEQATSVEIQKTVLDLIKALLRFPEGSQQFIAVGGYQYVVSVVIENNIDKDDAALLDMVVQLYRFFGVVELPIGSDNNMSWVPPLPPAAEDVVPMTAAVGATVDDGSAGALTADVESCLPDNVAPSASHWVGSAFSPELGGGEIDPETALLFREPPPAPAAVKLLHDPLPANLSAAAAGADTVQPVEELLVQVPSQLIDIVRREFRRLSDPSSVINRLVYDDLPRCPTLPSNALNQLASGTPSLPPLRFSSNFESGNLKRAIQIFDSEYDLILSSDVNTESYCQWFFFSVEGMRRDTTYKFNIINMEKPTSSFGQGQRVLLFSEKRRQTDGLGWLRAGHNIAYMKNSYRRRARKRLKKSAENSTLSYYTLTFCLRVPHDEDRVFIANSYPYTYTDLLSYLRLKQADVTHRGLNCMMVQSLCSTQAGNPTPLVTITSLSKNGVPCSEDEIRQRHVCVVSARVHPGETGASFCAHGLMDYILGSNDTAQYARDNIVWKIIPMLNPDGVVHGNHRCALSGRDLNREFVCPCPVAAPTVYYLKELIRHLKVNEGRTVMLYGDFHGHSRRDNFFVYSCGAERKLEVHGLTIERVFPRLLGELSPYFSYGGSSFKVQRSKKTTGRVVFYRQLGIRMSYTLEGSMMGGDNCDFLPVAYDDIAEDVARRVALARSTRAHFNTGHYAVMGGMFAKAATLITKAALEGEGRVIDLIHEMLTEVAQSKTGGAAMTVNKSNTSKACVALTSPAVSSPNAPEWPSGVLSDPDADAPFSGSFASNRRGSVRVTAKGAALRKVSHVVTAADVADVLSMVLKSVPNTKSLNRRPRDAAHPSTATNDSEEEEQARLPADEDDDEDEDTDASSGESSIEDPDDENTAAAALDGTDDPD